MDTVADNKYSSGAIAIAVQEHTPTHFRMTEYVAKGMMMSSQWGVGFPHMEGVYAMGREVISVVCP